MGGVNEKMIAVFKKGNITWYIDASDRAHNIFREHGYKSEFDIAEEERKAEKKKQFEKFKAYLDKNKDKIKKQKERTRWKARSKKEGLTKSSPSSSEKEQTSPLH